MVGFFILRALFEFEKGDNMFGDLSLAILQNLKRLVKGTSQISMPRYSVAASQDVRQISRAETCNIESVDPVRMLTQPSRNLMG